MLIFCIILNKLVGFMKKLLEIENLTIKNKEYDLIKNVSLCFYENVPVFLCGTSGSGKTLLLKAILGKIKYQGHISKFGNVEVIQSNTFFDKETIVEELNYSELEEMQKKIVHKFISKTFLNKKIIEVDLETKYLILLCKSLIKKPKLLFLDTILSFLSKKTIQKIYKYANKEHITLVNVSTDIEESLFYDYMIVLDKGNVAVEGKTLQVLEQEKLLKRLGIGLPFYIDLSIQLRLYGLINNLYSSKEDLESALWK